MLRVAAFHESLAPSRIISYTYILLRDIDDVPGLLRSMKYSVLNDPDISGQFIDSVRSLPNDVVEH